MNNSTGMFDPFDAAMKDDPYPAFRRFLDAGSVHPGKAPMPEYPGGWYVMGFHEVKTVLCSPVFIHERNKVLPSAAVADGPHSQQSLWEILGRWFLLRDPPSHTAMRGLAAGSFRKDALKHLDKHIEQTAARLLDQARLQGGLDLMWDYAYPLSLSVVVRILGISMPELRWFKSCTRAIADAMSVRDTTEAYAGAASALAELSGFLRESIAAQRASGVPLGMLGQLLYPSAEEDALGEDDIIALMCFMLFAGQETVSDAIGNGVYTLANHPRELACLQADTQRMANAVEEVLRFEPPVQYAVTRTAAADIEIDGTLIRKGDPVTAVLAAACRDARKYPDPDRFDVLRPYTGDTLVFGKGIHACLGLHLARLTLGVAFDRFLGRLPAQWRLAAPPVWRDNLSLRGPASLKIAF